MLREHRTAAIGVEPDHIITLGLGGFHAGRTQRHARRGQPARTGRRFGQQAARRVVLVGFALAVILSIWLATPRIALASGTAFLVAQLLDAAIFDRLRRQQWWHAPLFSTLIGSVIDTALFFSLAFAARFAFLDTAIGMEDGSLGFPVPFMGGEAPLWVSLAFGDFCVKMAIGLAMLAPYGALLRILKPAETSAGVGEDVHQLS